MSIEPPDEEENERRNIWPILGAALVIVLVGLWLMRTLHNYLAVEKCMEEGRRNCTGEQIEVPRQ